MITDMTARTERNADIILHNGKILTVDRDDSIHQAIAISGNRILAVGSNEEVAALAGPGTKSLDLRGSTVIPGVVDIHAHLDREGLKSIYPSLEGLRSIPQILDRIADLAADKAPGEWVVTMPVGDPPNYADMPQSLAEGRFPNRHDLDRVAPNNPVYIKGIWTPWNVPPSVSIANSAALAIAGIDRHTEAPDSSVTIEKDADGEPTGIFVDTGRYPSVEFTLMRAAPRFTPAQRVAALKESMRLYNSVGTTGTYEGHGVAPELLQAYKAVWDAGEMTVRANLTVSPNWQSAEQAAQEMESWGHSFSGPGFGDEFLRVSGYFIQYGGNRYTAQARSSQLPYTGWAGFIQSYHSPELFAETVKLAAENNIRVNTLVREPLEEVLNVFEEIDRDIPLRGTPVDAGARPANHRRATGPHTQQGAAGGDHPADRAMAAGHALPGKPGVGGHGRRPPPLPGARRGLQLWHRQQTLQSLCHTMGRRGPPGESNRPGAGAGAMPDPAGSSASLHPGRGALFL